MIDRLGNENAEYYTMDEINHTIDFLENNHKWPFALGDLLSNESMVFGNYDFSISISDSGAAEI